MKLWGTIAQHERKRSAAQGSHISRLALVCARLFLFVVAAVESLANITEWMRCTVPFLHQETYFIRVSLCPGNPGIWWIRFPKMEKLWINGERINCSRKSQCPRINNNTLKKLECDVWPQYKAYSLLILFPRVSVVPGPHSGSTPVLSSRGQVLGQSELWSSPAQHEPVQWEAAGPTGWTLLPVLTGERLMRGSQIVDTGCEEFVLLVVLKFPIGKFVPLSNQKAALENKLDYVRFTKIAWLILCFSYL